MVSHLRFALFLLLVVSVQRIKAQHVYLIPTIHKLHRVNKKYTYDSLKAFISHIRPDIIAVEIRQEDITADTAYLNKNYPLEMVMMRYWFPGKLIAGFDWLGDDITGKSIPDGYWKNMSPLKKYEQSLNTDSLYARKCEACDTFSNQREQLLQNLSMNELLQSHDAQLTDSYYQCLADQIKGSIHQRVLDFYDRRNRLILQNIQHIAMKYRGKTIVILTGDDHYIYLDHKISHQHLQL